jgi:hypothetical protein
MKIKEVPSKVFNEALDKWIGLAIGLYDKETECSYCNYFNSKVTSCETEDPKCLLCPLGINGYCHNKQYNNEEKLYWCWNRVSFINQEKTKKLALKMVDAIIETCIYEVKS